MLTTDKTVLFGIGAQKAGTSWLHSVLSSHPECHLPVKEVHYFDTAVDPARAESVLFGDAAYHTDRVATMLGY